MSTIASAGIYQENSPLIQYRGSGWNRVEWAAAKGGYLSRSDAGGAGVSLRFIGTEVIFHSVKGPGRGAPAIAIDGISRGQFDMAATSEAAAPIAFPDLAPGVHTIDVELVDDGLFLDIDGFEVKGTVLIPTETTTPPAETGITIPNVDQVKQWAKANPLLAVAGGFLAIRILLGPRALRIF
ncbi:MAG: hypothetical protein GXX85_17925 [Ignavibacteria bacterium]|nr:hypothetical protein [Ignavibacteria bacterium]